MNNENERALSSSVNAISSTASVAIKAGNALSTASTSAVAGSQPTIIMIVLIIIAIIVAYVFFTTAFNSSSLYNQEATKVEYITKALEPGFIKRKREAGSMIKNYVNSTYRCGGGISSLANKNTYTVSTDACEITIDFEPNLETFAQEIDSYAVAVNSTLVITGQAGSDEVMAGESPEFTENLIQLDGEQITFTEYGQSVYNSVDSEYINNQSEAYFKTLDKHSYDMFEVTEDTSVWADNVYRGTKTITVTECQKKITYTGKDSIDYVTVACELSHDREIQVEKEVEAWLGSITVPIECDVEGYKREDLEVAKNSLIGTMTYLPIDMNPNNEYEHRKFSNYTEVDAVVQFYIDEYLASYLAMFNNATYGYGWVGEVAPMGDWNYLEHIDLTGEAAGEFWAYAEQYYELIHPNGGYGASRYNCTYFADVFFHDVFGGTYVPGGNGNTMASHLVADCGVGQMKSGCPMAFEYGMASSPAPGMIVSLSPNHVICVDTVGSDGRSVFISEGNYDGHGGVRTHVYYESLDAYAKSRHMRIVAIAKPCR